MKRYGKLILARIVESVRGRRRWHAVLLNVGIAAGVAPILIGLHGRQVQATTVALVVGISLIMVLLCAVLLAGEIVDAQADYNDQAARRYVEGLRRYTVASIEPLRAELDRLGAEHVLPPPAEVPSDDADKPLKTRERDTLLRILYGMAAGQPYGYDPSAMRSDAAATIASATAAAGCSVDPDTVRKYLKQAADKFGRAR